jgi:hypothetical protein
MILQDARVAEVFTKALRQQKQRYEDIRAGGEFRLCEDVLPDREDFARVYKILRREFRAGNCIINHRDLMRLTNGIPDTLPMNYIKLKYILRIMNELKLCEVVELDHDIYRYQICFNASKTSIEKSSILKKLKSQCVDRNRQE